MNWMNADYFIPEWLAPQETRGREELGGKGEKGGESPFTHSTQTHGISLSLPDRRERLSFRGISMISTTF